MKFYLYKLKEQFESNHENKYILENNIDKRCLFCKDETRIFDILNRIIRGHGWKSDNDLNYYELILKFSSLEEFKEIHPEYCI